MELFCMSCNIIILFQISGDIEEGVEHLSNAVAVCGQPQQLLQVLQQTLPPQVFALLVQKLPSVGAVSFTWSSHLSLTNFLYCSNNGWSKARGN